LSWWKENPKVNAAGFESERLLPGFDKFVIQVRQACGVGLGSEVVKSKFGVSTKFEHSQTNRKHAII
jgi:hypothetical protein